jgi:hypothetical protein
MGVWSVAYSPDERHIISGSSDPGAFKSGIPRLVLQSSQLDGHTDPGQLSCLLSQWAAYHLWILGQNHSNLGC